MNCVQPSIILKFVERFTCMLRSPCARTNKILAKYHTLQIYTTKKDAIIYKKCTNTENNG